MSRTYDIQRWDGIILPSLNVPQPGVYIQPDEALLQLLSQRKVLSVKFKNTDSIYENKLAHAVVRPSAVTGGFRPNFQEKTGLVVLLPAITWESYPQKLGQVEILDFVEIPTTAEEFGYEIPQKISLCAMTRILNIIAALSTLFVIAKAIQLAA